MDRGADKQGNACGESPIGNSRRSLKKSSLGLERATLCGKGKRKKLPENALEKSQQ